MPEFVACPACGCRVQMAESMIGRTVRCINCEHRFTAVSPSEAETRRVEPLPALPEREAAPIHPTVGRADADPRSPREERLPHCPRCGRPVSWEAFRCPNCGEELEFDPGHGRFRRRSAPPRRDAEPHRAALLSGLGNVTLGVGGLTLCAVGVPLVVVLPLGIATWMMASHDLRKMRTGEMDPEGRGPTEAARTSAIIGLVLSIVFAAGWGLLALTRMFS